MVVTEIYPIQGYILFFTARINKCPEIIVAKQSSRSKAEWYLVKTKKRLKKQWHLAKAEEIVNAKETGVEQFSISVTGNLFIGGPALFKKFNLLDLDAGSMLVGEVNELHPRTVLIAISSLSNSNLV
jgi:hypothetical protein